MSRFTTIQIQNQLQQALIKTGQSADVAKSAAIAGANFYQENPGATVESAMAWAKSHLKSLKRVKGKAAAKNPRVTHR